ncbi:MAG: Rrf2 family transcriptional regulator [Proteobacteria bacterium]|nr:Rrf2 family transcriptional regulator [Pseudomonadota bacterium]
MLRPSKKLVCTIEAVLDIAYNAADRPVRAKEITRRQGVPPRFLEPVLQDLVRAGVLDSVRGPRGGYRLARERRRITLGDLCRASGAFEEASEEEMAPNGSILAEQVVRPLWADLRSELATRLESVTLDDLCQRAQSAGIPSQSGDCLDFNI